MTIQLFYKFLRYDVEQLTFRYGKARYNDNSELFDLAAMQKESNTDDNLIRRFCLTGVAKLRMILKEHIAKSNDDSNDILGDDSSWSFAFTSAEYDSTALASIMHWFIVRWCIWQWALAVSPDDAKSAKSELDEVEDDLNNLLLDAEMPTKVTRTDYDPSEDDELIIDEIVITNEAL